MLLLQDLFHGWRTLTRTPGFFFVAVVSLALGIGANTAIFSLLNSCLIKALPVRNAEQLVMLTNPSAAGVSMGSQTGERGLLSYPEFQELQQSADLFGGLLAVESSLSRWQIRLGTSDSEEVHGKLVSGGYFSTLGVEPEAGRFFDASVDSQLGNAADIVISDEFWSRRFGRDPAALGKTITIQRTAFTIIGVTPPSFFGETVGQRPDAWAPLSMELQIKPGRDWLHPLPNPLEKLMWLHVFGRLKPGVTISQAQAQANSIFKRNLAVSYQSLSGPTKKRFMDQKLRLRPAGTGASDVRERFTEPLFVVFAAVGAVLLICCANLTNLLLARANSRRREITVRLALGANKVRVIRQLLTESLLLSVLGALGGLLVARMAAPLLLRMASNPNNPVQLNPSLDSRVLLFTAAIAIFTTFIFGLAPAIRAAKTDINSTLREGSRGVTASLSRLRLGKLFVMAQVALSLVLLVGAGLFLRTFLNLEKVDLGYSRDRLLLISVDGVTAGYKDERLLALYRQLLDKFRNTPGVRRATFSENGLFSGSESGDQILVEGYTPKGGKDRGSRFDQIGPDYFSALGIPLLLGREINERDRRGGLLVCVINEAFAKLFFANRNPLGKHVTDQYGDKGVAFEVVGVAKDSRDHALRGDVPPRFFVAAEQDGLEIPPGVNFEIRTAAAPNLMLNALRRVVREVDINLPILSAESLGELVGERVAQDRLIANLTSIFGALALVLAAIGIYGVLAYGVSQRTSEIGIRMAVGAEARNVVGMILRETIVIILIGLTAGLIISVFVTRLIESRLFGLHAMDPIVLSGAVLIMSAIGLIAAYGPAWRASRIDPAIALRYE